MPFQRVESPVEVVEFDIGVQCFFFDGQAIVQMSLLVLLKSVDMVMAMIVGADVERWSFDLLNPPEDMSHDVFGEDDAGVDRFLLIVRSMDPYQSPIFIF
jgi:hypothetical protein